MVPCLCISSLLVYGIRKGARGWKWKGCSIEVLTSWMTKLVRRGGVVRHDEVARRLEVAILLMRWSTCFPTGTVPVQAMTARANSISRCKVTRIWG